MQQVKTSQNIFTINPYYRLHRSVSESIAFFVEINGLYGFGKGRNIIDTESYRFDGLIMFDELISESPPMPSEIYQAHQEDKGRLTMWGTGISPGIVFFPSNKFGIDLSIELFKYTEISSDISQTSSELSLVSDLSNIVVGGRFYISR